MENYYSHFTKDMSAKIGFEGNEIILNIPEDGENKEGWNIIPMTYPVVSSYVLLYLVISDGGTAINHCDLPTCVDCKDGGR